ncbi:MAG: hypothetical protein EA382_01725 [Spirochaetaceae bacterium]|nr:MAG: hypothetical protein EA382_01725 [Spirochaetaceae bacterium]
MSSAASLLQGSKGSGREGGSMIPMTVAAAVAGFFSLLLGYVVCRQTPWTESTPPFVLMSALLAAWAFVAVCAYSAAELPVFATLVRVEHLLQMLYLGAFLHFALNSTAAAPVRSWAIALVYAPAVATVPFFYRFAADLRNYSIVAGMWRLNQRLGSADLAIPVIVWALYHVIPAYCYLRRHQTPVPSDVRRRNLLLGTAVVVILVLSAIEGIVFPAAFDTTSIGPDLILKLGWLLCVAHLMERHRFLNASGPTDDVVLKELPEYAVFVLGPGGEVHSMNRQASLLVVGDGDAVLGQHLTELIPDHGRLSRELDRLRSGDVSSVATVAHVYRLAPDRMPMDLKVCALRDEDDGFRGYIVVGVHLPPRTPLETISCLSSRELDIVELVIEGRSNDYIAAHLSIAPRTVKSHLSHIYGKLQVDSRSRLFALLKRHRLISEHSADRYVLLPLDQ